MHGSVGVDDAASAERTGRETLQLVPDLGAVESDVPADAAAATARSDFISRSALRRQVRRWRRKDVGIVTCYLGAARDVGKELYVGSRIPKDPEARAPEVMITLTRLIAVQEEPVVPVAARMGIWNGRAAGREKGG